METQVITMKTRLNYLYEVFKDLSGQANLTFPEFMECVFSKLENEIRFGKSAIEKYYAEGEGKKKPISDQTINFIYDYEK